MSDDIVDYDPMDYLQAVTWAKERAQELRRQKKRIAEMEVELAALKCCGNCKHLKLYEYQGHVCSLDGISGGPTERCESFFNPSRWQARP